MHTIVSLVSYPFLPAKVGGQKGIALFNKYLARHVRLVCITIQNNDPSEAEGYEVRNILSNSPTRYINPFYFFKLRRVLKETGASHFLIEHPYYGWLGTLIKWTTNIRLIVHSHNMEGLRFKTLGKWWWKILLWYEGFTHRQAHYNFFIHDQDKAYAIDTFRLDPARCITVSYGIEWEQPPPAIELEDAGRKLRELHGIAADEQILFFNGAFDYRPNLEALNRIIDTIDPLLQQTGFRYRIIICGRHIPAAISQKTYRHITVIGFVEDIGLYFKGADIFLNPIVEGGGIKTKLVEALGYNLSAVSTANGAIGVDPAICNGKLRIVADNDWKAFVEAIVMISEVETDIPPDYFRHFYWDHSMKRIMAFIQ